MAEEAIRARLHGLAGMSPGFAELIDVAVYGARAGMLTVYAVPEVPALLPGSDFAGWEAPWLLNEQRLLRTLRERVQLHAH